MVIVRGERILLAEGSLSHAVSIVISLRSHVASGRFASKLSARTLSLWCSVLKLAPLLQFRVLGVGLPQDGYAGVRILPESEEILIRRARFCRVPFDRVRAAQVHVAATAAVLREGENRQERRVAIRPEILGLFR